jgi:hypothetical protein
MDGKVEGNYTHAFKENGQRNNSDCKNAGI